MIPYETYKGLHVLGVLLARAGPRRFLVPAVLGGIAIVMAVYKPFW